MKFAAVILITAFIALVKADRHLEQQAPSASLLSWRNVLAPTNATRWTTPFNRNDDNARVLIDTDTGVDDAVALIMALRGFREDAIVGITTVFGNVDLPQANHNVDFLLQALDRADIPVASGANRPIISKVSDERWPGHGPDGLGGVSGTVDVAHAAATVNDAVTMLIEKAREHRGELIVIALGSLTNVALAMLMDPSLVSSLKLLVVMGATSRGMGNLTPHAEFNIGCDPEAAEIVLQHCTADTLYIVPFETAISSSLKWTEFNEMFNGTDSNTKSLVRDMWQVAAKRASSFAPCDAYAVATLLDPALITSARTVHGQIHLSQDQWRGFSEWEDVASGIANQSTSSASLVSAVDREIFKRLLESLVAQ